MDVGQVNYAQNCQIPKLISQEDPQSQPVSNALVRLIERIHAVMRDTLKAFKGVLGDMNATSDLLRLVINGTKLAENIFDIPNFKLLARALAQITEFNSARSWLSRSYDIVSGDAATQEPIYGGWDYLRVLSKTLYLVNDACSTLKWLGAIGLLGEIAAKEIGTVRAFGYTAVMTVGRLAILSTIFGTIPNLIDNLRLVVKYAWTRGDMLEQERAFKLVCYSLDCVSDICRIASTILFALPNPGLTFLGIVVSTIGNCVSLSKFYYTERTRAARDKERIDYIAKKEAALCLCEKYLQLGIRKLTPRRNKVIESASQEALDAIRGTLKGMDQDTRPLMQSLTPEKLSQEILKGAEQGANGKALKQIQGALEQAVALNVRA